MRMRVCGKRRREKEGRGVLWGLMVMVTVITIYYHLLPIKGVSSVFTCGLLQFCTVRHKKTLTSTHQPDLSANGVAIASKPMITRRSFSNPLKWTFNGPPKYWKKRKETKKKNVTSSTIGTLPDLEDLLVMTLPTYQGPSGELYLGL